MVHFCIRLAGIPIGVTCQFPYTEIYCRDYICDETAQVEVTVESEDILLERERDTVHDNGSGQYTDRSACLYELSALLRKISEALVSFNILLLHGSAIAVDGYGYLFTARSGAGKSTHAALWRQELMRSGHDVYMINDDKPFIKVTRNEILVCGTPWSGKHCLDTNRMVPLHAIGKIEKSITNLTTLLPKGEYWTTMIKQSYIPERPELAERVLSMLQIIIEKTPCCRISCNMEPAAAQISWEMMSKKAGVFDE